MIRHTQSVDVLVLCCRPAESDVTVMPSVLCMDWLCWWYTSCNWCSSLFSNVGFCYQHEL